jgi:PleD family two-component response regulator
MHKKRILAVMSDLLFTVKINDAAKRAGMEVAYAKSEKEAFDMAKEKPSVVILDLNYDAGEPLTLIARLKGDEQLKGTSVIGFVSHVQGELKQKAQEAGCDMVMARSAFSQNLPQILRRHSGLVA